MIWRLFWYPLVSSKLAKMLGFKGYLPLPLTPTPRSKRELGQPLLSRERAKLRGRGKTDNWDAALQQLYRKKRYTNNLELNEIVVTIVFSTGEEWSLWNLWYQAEYMRYVRCVFWAQRWILHESDRMDRTEVLQSQKQLFHWRHKKL